MLLDEEVSGAVLVIATKMTALKLSAPRKLSVLQYLNGSF
jgi:hypothetical protein